MQVSFFAPPLAPSASSPAVATDPAAGAAGENSDVFASVLDSRSQGGTPAKAPVSTGGSKAKAAPATGNGVGHRSAAPAAQNPGEPAPAVNVPADTAVSDPTPGEAELGAAQPAPVAAGVPAQVPVAPQTQPTPAFGAPVLPVVAAVPAVALTPAPKAAEPASVAEAPAGAPVMDPAIQDEGARGDRAIHSTMSFSPAPTDRRAAPVSGPVVAGKDPNPLAPLPAVSASPSAAPDAPVAAPKISVSVPAAAPVGVGVAAMATAAPLPSAAAPAPVVAAPLAGVPLSSVQDRPVAPIAPAGWPASRSVAAPVALASPRPQSTAPVVAAAVAQPSLASAAVSPVDRDVPGGPASDPLQPHVSTAPVVTAAPLPVGTAPLPQRSAAPAVPVLSAAPRIPATPASPAAPRRQAIVPGVPVVVAQPVVATPSGLAAGAEQGKARISDTQAPVPVPAPSMPVVGPVAVLPGLVADPAAPVATPAVAALEPAAGRGTADRATPQRPVISMSRAPVAAPVAAPVVPSAAEARPALPPEPMLSGDSPVVLGAGEGIDDNASLSAVASFRGRSPVAWRTIEQARATGAQIVFPQSAGARATPPELALAPASTGEPVPTGHAAVGAMLTSPTLAQVLVESGAVATPRAAQLAPAKANPTAGNPIPLAATAPATPAPIPSAPVATVVPGAPANTATVPEITPAEQGAVALEEPADGEGPRVESPVRGLREILAAGSARTGRPEAPASKVMNAQNFLTVEKQRVGGGEREVGTRTANRTQPMPSHAPALFAADAALETFELPVAAVPAANQPIGAALKAPVDVGATRSFAAAAVREVMNVVEKAQEAGRNHLELRLPGQDNEGLRVHLDWRDGVVHTRFVAQTSEMQRSLSHEWETVAPRFAEKGLKFSEPSFERNGQSPDSQSGHTAFGSEHQHHRSRGQAAGGEDQPEFALPTAPTAGANAPTRRAAPRAAATAEASHERVDTRGLRVWA